VTARSFCKEGCYLLVRESYVSVFSFRDDHEVGFCVHFFLDFRFQNSLFMLLISPGVCKCGHIKGRLNVGSGFVIKS
jgi:hypothetical protein